MDNSGGPNDQADITIQSNGGLALQSYRYTDINRIDYQGTAPLHIKATGATSDVASAAAAMGLGINTSNNAAVSFDQLYSGYAAISVQGSSNVSVADGRIARTAYFDLNGLLGRVGDIDYPGINYAMWTHDTGGTAFQNPAMPDGKRIQDFVITGSAATAGPSIMKFDLNVGFTGSHPTLSSDGFLLSYTRSRVNYASPSGDGLSVDDKQSIDFLLGQNLPITKSVGLKVDTYSAQLILNQPVSSLGYQNISTVAAEEENTVPAGNEAAPAATNKKSFPANFAPSILDSETGLDTLNIASLGQPSDATQ